MVLIEQHTFNMRDSEDYSSMYPEPPQGVSSFAPMELNLSPHGFAYPRPDCFPTTTGGFEGPVLFAEAPPFMFTDCMSPVMYQEDARAPSSNLSTASIPSAPSSAVGSPRSNHGQPHPVPEWAGPQGLGMMSPNIVGQGEFYGTGEYGFHAPPVEEFPQFEYTQPKPGFVDPSILRPDVRPMGIFEAAAYPPPPPPQNGFAGSPAMTNSPQMRHGSVSPYPSYPAYGTPFQSAMDQGRRPSAFSGSVYSGDYHTTSDGESKEKQRCPHPDCGKTFKDLKAHMLTHQTERPEKCPIQTCDYHIKGFARKYDKNRHTLTHYKGTMVCGFCPGSGSAAEKSFNRADVFKRHLTAVHGVEQTPPNSRKKTAGANSGKKLTGYAPDATGKCSTCSQNFSNAQDFYEHLDDCVLRIVQQEDPTEAVNAKRLAEVENDKEVHETLEKNNLPTTTQMPSMEDAEDDEEMDEDDYADDDFNGRSKTSASPRRETKGNPANGVQKSKGLTHSRGGRMLVGKKGGRKHRRDYPTSWGFDKGQMTMKKRVTAVFDGPRRLAKDDLCLSTDNEVRIKLADGKSYVTDLDIFTMKRSEAFLDATEEEKGPWISDDPTEEQRLQMAAGQQQ